MSVAPARSAHTGPSSAITAFVHGVERRARALARLQAGDASAGDRALADVTRAFVLDAGNHPLAQWPQRFWSTLLAAAPMRQPASGASGWRALAPGPRAALLLRWAGGLDDATAAQALGVSAATFRLALQHALDAAGDGAAALQADVDACLALSGSGVQAGPEPAPQASEDERSVRPRRLLAVLWALLAACLVAFAATFFAPSGTGATARVGALPDAEPAARYDAAAALVVHRDFALLVDADAAPWLDDLEFHAWLAAGAPGPADAHGADTTAPVFTPVAPDAALETFDAPL
jgi:hypothetical protein